MRKKTVFGDYSKYIVIKEMLFLKILGQVILSIDVF
jgi:hypothetical protein